MRVNALFHTFRIGDEQIVAHHLTTWYVGRELGEVVPAVLVERILDRHHRVLADVALVHFGHLFRTEQFRRIGIRVLEVQIVLALERRRRGKKT